jgi:glycosyltransferase involved in cell wall biosynthesis
MNLAVVLSHPTQYYSPWFRWIAANTDIRLRVFYLWDFGVTQTRDRQFQTAFKWDVDLLSGYEHEFVPNVAADPGTHHFGGLRNPELTARLGKWAPDAVLLFGYKSPSHLRAVAWARRRRVPLLFRGDSHFLGRGCPGLPTRLALRALYAQFSAFLAVGAANQDYFRVLGVPERKLFHAPHSVNADLFRSTDERHRAAAASLRTSLGIAPSTRVLLFAGKLVPAKQPLPLIDAFLQARVPDTALVIVGDGPERALVAERAAGAAGIHLLPFANQSEMPARYALADVFALPSSGFYETWGLAVNEAMHMGVPALVSDRVGCQRDLVTHGETGWVFKANDPADLSRVLDAALRTPQDEQRRISAAAAARVSRYTYEQTTAGLQRALASAVGKSAGDNGAAP